MSRTITAYFDSRSDAQNAVDRLVAAGVTQSDVEIHGAHAAAGTSSQTHDDRSFFEKLGDFFMPDDDRDSYAEGVRRGGSVVTVRSQSVPFDRIGDILEEAGAVDLEGRETQWRAEGWTNRRETTISGYETGGRVETGRVSDAAYGRSSDAGVAGIGTGSADQRMAASTPYPGTGSAATTGTGMQGHAGSAADTALGGAQRVADRLGLGRRETDHGRSRIRSYVPLESSEDPSMLRGADRASGLGERRTDVEVEDGRDKAVLTPEERVRRGY